MAERITLAIQTTQAPQFTEFVAAQATCTLVEQRVSTLIEGFFTLFTIEAEEAWYFFDLGLEWGRHQLREGGPANG